MKFDVVIGNPPYQEKSQSIYQKFIDLAIRNSKQHVVMIVKNNWMVSDTLKDTRDNMIKNGLVKVIDYPRVGEVFKNVRVAVNIFHVDKKSESETEFKSIQKGKVAEEYVANYKDMPIIFNSRMERDIVAKVSKDLKERDFSSQVYPAMPFGVTTNFKVRSDNTMITSEEETDYYNIKVAYMEGRSLKFKYTNISEVPTRKELINEYKIICGRILNKNSTVVSNIRGLGKGAICTGSWAVIYSSKSMDKAKNAYDYARTRFFRYLVRVLCEDGAIAISPYRFTAVPMQDFSKSWTDEELYEKYNLTKEEIAHIESTIDAAE